VTVLPLPPSQGGGIIPKCKLFNLPPKEEKMEGIEVDRFKVCHKIPDSV
jgi:hypothetical protein